MRLTFLTLALISSHLAGCATGLFSDENQGQIIADTLEVSISRDETPGFPYPMMRHEVKFVGRLSVSGLITEYSYESRGVGSHVIYDFVGGYSPPAGTRFSHEFLLWDNDFLEPGVPVEYSFGAYGLGGVSLVKTETKSVRAFVDGPRPVSNSVQLTGPNRWNSQPVFSGDGQWVYFVGDDRDANSSAESIRRIPVSGGVSDPVVELEDGIASFALTRHDSALVYVKWASERPSQLMEIDLASGEKRNVVLERTIGGRIVAVRETHRLIGLAYDNGIPEDLVLIDGETGAVETLVPRDDIGWFLHFDHRPGTSQISIVAQNASDVRKVYLLDLDTRERTLYLDDFSGLELVWMTNGEDYAYVGPDEAGFFDVYLSEAGADRRLTIYPGEESGIAISSDGFSIAFTARRRGEVQIWRVDL